jgi:hypothetical protein
MKTRIKMVALIASLTGFYSAVAFAAPVAKVEVAKCNDGKTMMGTPDADGKVEHRGACSGHGGVASWADGTPVKSHAKKTEYK